MDVFTTAYDELLDDSRASHAVRLFVAFGHNFGQRGHHSRCNAHGQSNGRVRDSEDYVKLEAWSRVPNALRRHSLSHISPYGIVRLDLGERLALRT